MNQLRNIISPQHMYALYIFAPLPVVYKPLWSMFSVLDILLKQTKGQQSRVHILWDILYFMPHTMLLLLMMHMYRSSVLWYQWFIWYIYTYNTVSTYYNDIAWALKHHKSPTIWPFVQEVHQVDNKETIKLYNWPIVREPSTPHKWKVMQK